ncbi:MAG TPA: hypothetical protein VMV37_00975, partial [Gammaproteobacteria bacterium]|nr:hypothetical protein [Gammaproteobacteria bacterium]
ALCRRLAALCAALALGGAAAAQDKPGSPGQSANDAPDEIVVLGRINELRTEVQRSEEAFYDRFNEINGDHKFDIHCRLEPLINSHIPRRVCASNQWHDMDAKIGAAALREARSELGSTPDSLVTEQAYAQKQLTEAMRRATAEDPQLQQAIVRFVAAKRALEAQMAGLPRHSAAQQIEPGADGLPYGARAMFVVRAGKEPWIHPLTQGTFTIANVAGEVRNLDLKCAQGERAIQYQEGVDWTVPHGWAGCTLSVGAAPATMFNFYEFE